MRVVLYANDFEPITVIDLPEAAYKYLKIHKRVSLPVNTPASYAQTLEDCTMLQVDIFSQAIRFPNGEHLMLFTNDDEAALLLKSSFLPGQRPALEEERKKAFANGFLDALMRIGGA